MPLLPTLSGMPPEIKLKIVGLLGTKNKLPIRLVSKGLKNAVDMTEMRYGTLSVEVFADRAEVSMSYGGICDVVKKSVEFRISEGGYYLIHYKYSWVRDHRNKSRHDPLRPRRFWEDDFTNRIPSYRLAKFKKNERFVKGRNIEDAVVEQFVKLLRNPKVTLENIKIQLPERENEEDSADKNWRDFREKLYQTLDTFTHKLSAEKLIVSAEDPNRILQILTYFKPGALKTLELSVFGDNPINNGATFLEISETEQWKQAKDLSLRGCNCRIHREITHHFPRFSTDNEHFDQEELGYIIDNILRPDGWEYRQVKKHSLSPSDVYEYISKRTEPKSDLRVVEKFDSRIHHGGVRVIDATTRGPYMCRVIIGFFGTIEFKKELFSESYKQLNK